MNLKSFHSEYVNFSALQNIDGMTEYIGVEAIDFTVFSDLEAITIENNNSALLSNINVSGLTNLEELFLFGVITGEDQSSVTVNMEGCTSLIDLFMANSFLDIDFCQAPSSEKVVCWGLWTNNVDLDFNCLSNLNYLNVAENQINSLFLKNGSVLDTFINYETSINLLCIDDNPEELASLGNLPYVDIITTNCNLPLGDNMVSGQITNNYATNELFSNPINFELVRNATITFNIQNAGYNYELPLVQGDYQITPIVSFTDGYNIVPDQFAVSFTEDSGGLVVQNLSMEPRVETVNGIEIKFYPFNYSITGPRFDYYIVLTNTNDTSFTGSLRLDYDGNYSNAYDYNDEWPNSNSDGNVLWSIFIQANSSVNTILRISNNTELDPTYPLFSGDQLVYDLFLIEDLDRVDNTDTTSFRLINTINGGTPSLSDEDVEGVISSSKIEIYPNPSQGMVNIAHNLEIKAVSIFSVNGQLVNFINYKQSNSELIRMDVSNLEKGLYFLSIKTDTTTFVEKIIIN